MIEVSRISIPKEKFDKLGREDRAAVFVAGHVLNQIGVFQKLLRLSSARDPENSIEEKASSVQTQILLRSLMGALAEATVWFGDRPTLIDRYLSNMPQEGRDAYEKLKENFSRNSFMRRLRNNFLYHYPNEKNADKAFRAIPADDSWEWYLSEKNTNSVYFSSELVLSYGLMSETGEKTTLGAFGIVMSKTMDLANTMPEFLMYLVQAILTRHLGTGILEPSDKVTISDAARFEEFWIPFYID